VPLSRPQYEHFQFFRACCMRHPTFWSQRPLANLSAASFDATATSWSRRTSATSGSSNPARARTCFPMDDASSAVHRRRTSPTPGLNDWRRMPSKQISQFSAVEMAAILVDSHLGQTHFPNTYFMRRSLSADIRAGVSIGGWNPGRLFVGGSRNRQSITLPDASAPGRVPPASVAPSLRLR